MFLQSQHPLLTVRKIEKAEKDAEMKEEGEGDDSRPNKDEADSDDDDESGMKKKEEAEALEVRDVAYNLETLAQTMCNNPHQPTFWDQLWEGFV